MSMGIANLGVKMMDIKAWISNPKVIANSKKGYAHFDLRTDITKVSEYISNPEKVARHSFYPFIHYVMRMDKYNKKTGVKPKTREICYAAHMDRCIYQYYSAILNENYNKYCLVLIGDFTGFFDSLDHQYLKQQWCKVMGFDFLPQDHYAVFKNVTKYSMWELDDLLSITGLSQKEFNKRRLALSKEEYRNNRSHISRNNKTKQIPQGSPISAVLANIYMINADKEIHDYVKALGGMYMRYSDDFIVIVPANRSEIACFKNVLSILKGIPNLELEPSKTQIFAVAESRVENIGRDLLEKADVSKKVINFLGFTFDGQSVSVRSKTISKYYYRMYRKAKSISKNPTLSGADNLYKSYSIHGAKAKPGNFFTYINHAKEVFGEDELIDRDLKNHIPKIRKALKGKK